MINSTVKLVGHLHNLQPHIQFYLEVHKKYAWQELSVLKNYLGQRNLCLNTVRFRI